MNSSLPPSGWYPDPAGQAGERFWDGENWSQATRSASSPQPAHPATAPGQAQQSPGGAPQPYGQQSHYGSQAPYAQQGAYAPQGSYAGYPYQARPAMHIAGWGWRLLAYLIDGFILGIPLSLVQSRLTMPAMDAYSNWLMDLTRGQQGPFPQEMINAWLLSSLISLVVWILYRTAMVAWKGGSLGQLILGMRVVRDGDQSLAVPTLGTAASRAVVAMILFTLPLVGLVNGLWPLFNDKRQALHDLVAKTVVLKKY